MLEQAFKPKLAGSSIRDISGELLRTTAEAPYIDADWVKAESNEFESIHHKSDSEFDDDFEDLSSEASK
ncbi:hypothetical protein H2136_05660 [Aeromonas hydrophila]|uniref:Uncharacterized protein n=1 Tax=Aeromonas hydrophila TaxID=644 RepID=A0A926FN70_AERHY|nr:hypothetical protein [Aeromonas hydrophila]